jgi:hypothetical protein
MLRMITTGKTGYVSGVDPFNAIYHFSVTVDLADPPQVLACLNGAIIAMFHWDTASAALAGRMILYANVPRTPLHASVIAMLLQAFAPRRQLFLADIHSWYIVSDYSTGPYWHTDYSVIVPFDKPPEKVLLPTPLYGYLKLPELAPLGLHGIPPGPDTLKKIAAVNGNWLGSLGHVV